MKSRHTFKNGRSVWPEAAGSCYLAGLGCVLLVVVLLLTSTTSALAAPKITVNILIADWGNDRVIEVDSSSNVVWQYGTTGVPGSGANQLNKPIRAERLPNGNTLISDGGNDRIIEVTPSKTVVWQYDTAPGTKVLPEPSPLNGPRGMRLGSGNTLLSDTNNARVIEVDPSGALVWQYGTTGVPGSGADQVDRPMYVTAGANGDRFVGDRQNHRVIGISPGGNIVWQYGTTGESGTGANHLYFPVSATPLTGGNILISDMFNHRIIEVDTSGGIVWQYGTTGVPGSGANQLRFPVTPSRLTNGNTVVSDRQNHRVIEVDAAGNIVWQFGVTGVSGSDDTHLNAAVVASGQNANPLVPVGAGVRVSPVDKVVVVFSNVAQTGTSSATVSSNLPAGLPSGFTLRGNLYDIQTSSSFDGPITVTIPYDQSLIQGSEGSLKLFHWTGSGWEDATVSVDIGGNTITGRVSSLSPFGVGEAEGGSGSGSGSSTRVPSSSAWSLALILAFGILTLWRSLQSRA